MKCYEFTPEELKSMAEWDREIDEAPAWDPVEVAQARKRDQQFADDKVMPKQLRKRQYDREYYQRNRERINQRNAEYAKVHAAEIREYRQEYYRANAESIGDRRKAYAQANQDSIAEYQRQYHLAHKAELNAYSREYCAAHRQENAARSKAWREANPERSRELKRQWWEKHKDEINARRRKKKRGEIVEQDERQAESA